jgi:hypothetical protein
MSDENLPKWVKPLLEFGPVLAFFVAYLKIKGTSYTLGGSDYDGFILVTALFVPLLLLCTGDFVEADGENLSYADHDGAFGDRLWRVNGLAE